jgi:hypothetical protein
VLSAEEMDDRGLLSIKIAYVVSLIKVRSPFLLPSVVFDFDYSRLIQDTFSGSHRQSPTLPTQAPPLPSLCMFSAALAVFFIDSASQQYPRTPELHAPIYLYFLSTIYPIAPIYLCFLSTIYPMPTST